MNNNHCAASRSPAPVPAALAPGAVLGRMGTLEVRLAESAAEIEAAQSIRYRVFHQEMGARGGLSGLLESRDADRFDDVCDHLLVLDTSIEPAQSVVGTYRLLRQGCADAAGGFYTSGEFDIGGLVGRHPELRFLELGRSCVLPAYRSKRTIELLWQGIWAYVRHYDIGAMTGCASFPGTVPAVHAEALSFLAQNLTASGDWAARALPSHYGTMDLMPQEAVDGRAALAAMPPLIKGYLRLGAMVGDGCVVDHDFGTTDILVILPVASIRARYVNHYGTDAERFAA